MPLQRRQRSGSARPILALDKVIPTSKLFNCSKHQVSSRGEWCGRVLEPHKSLVDSHFCENIIGLPDPDPQDNGVHTPPSTLNNLTFK